MLFQSGGDFPELRFRNIFSRIDIGHDDDLSREIPYNPEIMVVHNAGEPAQSFL